ncbi:MAG: hypothetical protein V8R14_09425 [Clostridia bacterium]
MLNFAENIESREFIQDYRKRSMVIRKKRHGVQRKIYSVAPEKELEGMPAKCSASMTTVVLK